MLVFAREVFVCRCSTDVPRVDPDATGVAKDVVWHKGTEADFDKLPDEHHGDEHRADFRERLARGEHWMLGLTGDKLVSYTWLSRHNKASYPSLPGCEITLSPQTGYGYDAWTPPELRGQGLRRVGFLEELNVLRHEWGLEWEASFFVRYQLEGATRSLGKVGIVIEPLWRVWLGKNRKLNAEKVADDASDAVPDFIESESA